MKKSLGLIETQGLAAGIEAADAAVKSANVRLIGYELTKGGGWTTIKVEGDVGAVKAAVDAARMAAAKVNQVVSTRVIPRPSAGLDLLVHNPDTVGDAQPAKEPDMPDPPTPPKGAKQVKEEQTAGQEEPKAGADGEGLKPGPAAESAQGEPEGTGPSEGVQAAGSPEAEEGTPPQEAPVVVPKPAKRAAAQKGRKGAKRSNKQENTEKE